MFLRLKTKQKQKLSRTPSLLNLYRPTCIQSQSSLTQHNNTVIRECRDRCNLMHQRRQWNYATIGGDANNNVDHKTKPKIIIANKVRV